MDNLIAKETQNYGISVHKISDALEALSFPTGSIQIVFNIFRQKPIETLFDEAKKKFAIIARGPLASELTGEITKDTQFAENDHRNYNRRKYFDVGTPFRGRFWKRNSSSSKIKKIFCWLFYDRFIFKVDINARRGPVVIPGAINKSQVNNEFK